MIRSFIFAIFYWVISLGVLLPLVPLCFLPNTKGLIRKGVTFYAKAMRFAMYAICGIKFEYRGLEHLQGCPYIIASKHQSWGDGFGLMSQVGDMAIVTGDHIEVYPFVPMLLEKIGAIVVEQCGGHKSRKRISESFEIAKIENRNVLIYPEGKLVAIGENEKIKSGVFHMYQTSGWPVIPVANNLGLFWPERKFLKEKGVAINEFFAPIEPGLNRQEFFQRLEESMIEGSKKIVAESQAKHPYLTQANIEWK